VQVELSLTRTNQVTARHRSTSQERASTVDSLCRQAGASNPGILLRHTFPLWTWFLPPFSLPLPATSTRGRWHCNCRHLEGQASPKKNYLTSATTKGSRSQRRPSSSSLLPPSSLPTPKIDHSNDHPTVKPPSPHKSSRALSYPFPPPPIENRVQSLHCQVPARRRDHRN
jgi:hypothetical protein